MDQVTDINVEEVKESPWIRPYRMHYTQNGVKKTWDLALGRPRQDNFTIVITLVQWFLAFILGRPQKLLNGIYRPLNNHINVKKMF